jgi:hypothetical protein
MVAWGKRDSERSPRLQIVVLCALARPIPPPFQGVGKSGSLTRGCIRRLIDPRLISMAPPGANLLLRPGWPHFRIR